MNRFNSVCLVVAAVIQSFAFAMPAFAANDSMASVAEFRHNFRSSLIQLQGNLSCQMGELNNGEGCTLKLQETKTGKIFELTHAATAMRLYQNGVKTVSIEGSPDGAGATNARIAIVRVNAL